MSGNDIRFSTSWTKRSKCFAIVFVRELWNSFGTFEEVSVEDQSWMTFEKFSSRILDNWSVHTVQMHNWLQKWLNHGSNRHKVHLNTFISSLQLLNCHHETPKHQTTISSWCSKKRPRTPTNRFFLSVCLDNFSSHWNRKISWANNQQTEILISPVAFKASKGKKDGSDRWWTCWLWRTTDDEQGGNRDVLP